ncbi:hypothetical protein FNF27_06045 [Cafeteria roenbergensis]|nr:hypothetical protein FNF27_06045 [Cafeteria roenbergensis]
MDENGVWKWMSRVEYEHWLLSVAANKARARPSDERALLDLEVRRMQLRAEIAKAEGKAGIAMDDLAVRPEDLRATADAATCGDSDSEGPGDDEAEWEQAAARSADIAETRA